MPENKKRNFTSFVAILVITFFVFNFVFPKYLNKGIDTLKPKIVGIPVLKYLPRLPEKPFKLGLDLQGGSRLVYQAEFPKNTEEQEKREVMSGLRDVIERRVNLFGVGEPVVITQEVAGSHRLIIELPGAKDIKEAIEMIGKTPYLEFKKEREEKERDDLLQKQKQIQEKIKTENEIYLSTTTQETTSTVEERIKSLVSSLEDPYFEPTGLTGKYLKKATLGFDETTYEPQVLLEFNDEGTEIFKDLTSKNVGKRLAIYIDNVLLSSPVVREVIPHGKAQITGNFTIQEAKDLARNLQAGALPVPIELISQTTVGPTLGLASLQKSLKAGIVGFLAILLFMIVFYRLPGFFASVSLLIYVVLILAFFKLISVTLTLAGIAGFILSLGMAVDANILIFSRTREELKEGRDYLTSLKEGLRRAWPSIRDGNFTTILVGVILFAFGTGFVKGFALTLIIGNLAGMFAAIFITNNFLKCFPEPKNKKLSWLWR